MRRIIFFSLILLNSVFCHTGYAQKQTCSEIVQEALVFFKEGDYSRSKIHIARVIEFCQDKANLHEENIKKK